MPPPRSLRDRLASIPLPALWIAGAVGICGIVAGALLLLRGGSGMRAEREYRQAAAAALEAAARKWVLEARAGYEVVKLVDTYPSGGDDGTVREADLRRWVRDHLDSSTIHAAEELIDLLDASSRELIEDSAGRLGESQAQLVLEWLASRGWRVLERLHRTASERNPPQGVDSVQVLALFDGSARTSPTATEEEGEERVRVRYLGVEVFAEVDRELARKATIPVRSVYLRSSYASLHEGGDPRLISFGVVEEGGAYRVQLEDELREYLNSGNKDSWCIAIRNRRAPGSLSAEDLFERLTPAVPLVSVTGGLPGAGSLSTGSGFLVEDAGTMYVITNFHVILQAGEWLGLNFYSAKSNVRLLSTNARPADCLAHESVDLAAIPLNENRDDFLQKGIRPLALAPDDLELRRGQDIFVVGHPGGGVFTATAAKGSISGLEWSAPGVEGRFIQIDATINPGNSGGPLADSRGRVLGVVTWKYGEGQGIAGALYARYARELLKGASVPFLKKREEQLGPLFATWRSDQVKLEQTGKELEALGLSALGDAIGAVLLPTQEATVPLELPAGRSYGIWVLIFDMETKTLAELGGIEIRCGDGVRFEVKPVPAGSLHLARVEGAIQCQVRLRNPSARPLQVALFVLAK